jgi:hypothetical protein
MKWESFLNTQASKVARYLPAVHYRSGMAADVRHTNFRICLRAVSVGAPEIPLNYSKLFRPHWNQRTNFLSLSSALSQRNPSGEFLPLYLFSQ